MLYITTAFVLFLVGGVFALVIRTELAVPGLQLVDPETYNQLFTIHGTTMIFLFVMPMWTGIANYIVPLQVGAADMAFPRINALSYWMVPLGGDPAVQRLRRWRRGERRLDRLRAAVGAGRPRAWTCGWLR